MLNSVYLFMLHPLRFVQERREKRPLKLMILVLACVAFSFSALITHSVGGLFLMTILFVLLQLFLLFIQSVTVDFFAQLFFKKAKGLSLFSFLGLSHLPLTLFLPIVFIKRTTHIWAHFFNVLILVLFFWMLIYQVYTIKSLYDLKWRHSITLYFVPLMVATLSVIIPFLLFGAIGFIFSL